MQLKQLISYTKKSTLLGAGPMSKNCVISAINLSNKKKIIIILIASRRQIECERLGGGYVNNWTTEKFSKFVSKYDKKKMIFLARDHGGPWQGTNEENYSLKQSMEVAKRSFEVDIDSNFKFIHIDTSFEPQKKISIGNSLNRFSNYLNIVLNIQKNKKVYFEIGTEEQSGSTNTPEELEYTLSEVKKFCNKKKYEMPKFVVIQSGTKVIEMRNIGSFQSPLRIENELAVEIQLPKMIEICKKFKILMKEHNADYLSNHSLSLHPKLNIHAANIAPEFGVVETKSLLSLMLENNLHREAKKFLDISYSSKKWHKWILPGSKISKKDKSIISGHYVFSSKEFKNLKIDLIKKLNKKIIDVDNYLQKNIRNSMNRYIKNFNLN